MKEYHKQTLHYVSLITGALSLFVICVMFNYFITQQHKEAEQRKFERQVEEVKRFLNEQKR